MTKINFLKGYYGMKLTKEMVSERYLSWLNDRDVTRYTSAYKAKHSIETIKKYVVECNEKNDIELYGLFSPSKEHIGNVRIMIDKRNKTFDGGYIIGEKNYWGTEAGEHAICLILELGFINFNLRKHFGGIAKTNFNARFTAKKVGLKEYAIQKERNIIEGNLIDTVLVEISSKEWKIRRKKYV